MESIWEYCFDLLQYSQMDDCKCLLTEPMDNNKDNRMKTCEYFFEKFSVAKFLLINQSVLSFYNAAKTNGLIIDSGHSKTHIVPIYDGYALHSNAGVLKISGLDIQNSLMNALNQISRKFTSRRSMNLIQETIKNNCYFALDYEKELDKMKTS